MGGVGVRVTKEGPIQNEHEGPQDSERPPLKRGADRYFGENKAHADLGRASVRGGVILVAGRGVNVLVQLASTILLARLLSPHEFGLVAIVAALVLFAPILVDLGTTDASTQKSNITHVEISALFWLNVTIGCALTMLFAACSGAIAVFFGEPQLTGIALILSLTFVLTAISIQHYALMRRAMEFRRIAIIDLSSNAISSIVSVALALSGWGYWALVAKPIVQLTLTALGAWTSCRWLPGRPRVSAGAKELVGFGLGVTGFTIMDTLSRSADRIALGYFNGAGSLGYFQNAFLLYFNLLNIVTEPMHNIGVSSLSKLRDNVAELKRSWSAALSSMTFFCAPAFAALAVTGQDFAVMLLGQKWAPAGPLLCVFAVRGIANTVERTMGWLHVVAGRSDRWMRWGVFSAICHLVALAAGLPFGAMGVAVAYTVAMFGLFVPALVYAGRPIGIGTRDVLSATAPQMISAIITVAFGLAVQRLFLLEFSEPARFVISILICSVTYLAIVLGVFRMTGPLKLATSLLRDFAPSRGLRA
jgi:polysaccharide transporter, PST family